MQVFILSGVIQIVFYILASQARYIKKQIYIHGFFIKCQVKDSYLMGCYEKDHL